MNVDAMRNLSALPPTMRHLHVVNGVTSLTIVKEGTKMTTVHKTATGNLYSATVTGGETRTVDGKQEKVVKIHVRYEDKTGFYKDAFDPVVNVTGNLDQHGVGKVERGTAMGEATGVGLTKTADGVYEGDAELFLDDDGRTTQDLSGVTLAFYDYRQPKGQQDKYDGDVFQQYKVEGQVFGPESGYAPRLSPHRPADARAQADQGGVVKAWWNPAVDGETKPTVTVRYEDRTGRFADATELWGDLSAAHVILGDLPMHEVAPHVFEAQVPVDATYADPEAPLDVRVFEYGDLPGGDTARLDADADDVTGDDL